MVRACSPAAARRRRRPPRHPRPQPLSACAARAPPLARPELPWRPASSATRAGAAAARVQRQLAQGRAVRLLQRAVRARGAPGGAAAPRTGPPRAVACAQRLWEAAIEAWRWAMSSGGSACSARQSLTWGVRGSGGSTCAAVAVAACRCLAAAQHLGLARPTPACSAAAPLVPHAASRPRVRAQLLTAPGQGGQRAGPSAGAPAAPPAPPATSLTPPGHLRATRRLSPKTGLTRSHPHRPAAG